MPSVAAGFELGRLHPGPGGRLGEPVDGVDPDLGDRVRVALRHGLDLHAALGGEHAEVLLGRAVEREAGVVLLGDVRGELDPHDLDRVALDVHAEDVPGVGAHLVGVVGELDAARLAPAADLHLGLHHHRVADALGGGDGVVDGRHGLAGADGDPVAREELLALVLVEVHARLLALVSDVASGRPILGGCR